MYTSDEGTISRITTAYFNDLKKIKPLNRQEERALLEKYQKNNDISARDKLIKHNLRFACKYAAKFRRFGISYSDLISDANMGLLESINKYNLNKDVKLITYSKWWIMQHIKKAIKCNTLLAEELLPEEFDPLVGDNDDERLEDGRSNAKLYKDEKVDAEKQEQISQAIDIALNLLTPREADMINMYFGRGYDCMYTYEAIGVKYGITKERVRQIISKSKRKLKTCGALTEVKTSF